MNLGARAPCPNVESPLEKIYTYETFNVDVGLEHFADVIRSDVVDSTLFKTECFHSEVVLKTDNVNAFCKQKKQYI